MIVTETASIRNTLPIMRVMIIYVNDSWCGMVTVKAVRINKLITSHWLGF